MDRCTEWECTLWEGAATHFKSKFQAYELSNPLRNGSFCAQGHGNSSCHGVDGVMKHSTMVHDLHAPVKTVVWSVEAFVDCLRHKLTNVTLPYLPTHRFQNFWKMKQKECRHVPELQEIYDSLLWVKESANPGKVPLLKKRMQIVIGVVLHVWVLMHAKWIPTQEYWKPIKLNWVPMHSNGYLKLTSVFPASCDWIQMWPCCFCNWLVQSQFAGTGNWYGHTLFPVLCLKSKFHIEHVWKTREKAFRRHW